MLKLNYQIVLIAILMCCFTIISCEEAKQMMEPVIPSTETVEETPEPPMMQETPEPMVETPEPPMMQETPEPMVETPEPPMMQETSTPITISEIMFGSEPRFSPPQWIEVSNTGTETINMTGWKLTIQNVDSEDLIGSVDATIVFEDEFWGDAPRIWPNDILLIVTDEEDTNSGGFEEDQIFALRWRGGLEISFWDTYMSTSGFLIKLIDEDGNLVDEVGNYDGTATLWNLPYGFNRGRTRAGNRTSLMRRYNNGIALDGTLQSSWLSAADANLTENQTTYYGNENDIGSPGIPGPETGQ